MKRPRGRPTTINFKHMTLEEKRQYNNAVSRKRYVPKKKPIDFGALRQCRHCHEVFDRTIENFYENKNGKFGLSTICKACSKRAHKAWVAKNKFGGTVEEYEAIMRDASCAICGATERLCLDHCHDKNHVRGVLCALCNTGLGMFKDQPYMLRAAAAYLEDRKNGLP